MDIMLFFWNCQRTGHLCFHNFISEYRNVEHLDIICLFETRNSGSRANKIIARIGMNKSFWVEANGFARGIWILWNATINVDTVCFTNQLVHLRVKNA